MLMCRGVLGLCSKVNSIRVNMNLIRATEKPLGHIHFLVRRPMVVSLDIKN